MPKGLWLAAIFLVGLGMADAQRMNWNLSRDIRASNSQISFNQGANHAWYFMESSAAQHNPQIYRLLPEYLAPCLGNPGDKSIDGLACWREPLDTFNHAPLIGVNFTDQPQFPLFFPLPAQSVYLHPAPDLFAIVAWKAPWNSIVRVSGTVTDLDPNCGNGVRWSIDRGGQGLKTADLPNGGSQAFELPFVPILKGQVLYFVLDAKDGDFFCDTTMLDLKIAER